MNQIARIGGQVRVVARKFNLACGSLESQLVADVDRLHDAFEFMKAIGAPAKDVQQQIDFAERFFFERHEWLSRK